MNGLAGNRPPRRLARETRHLLIAALAALVMLWVLARLRFPEGAATSNPLPPLLSQLSVRPGFAELDSEISRIQRRLTPSLVAFTNVTGATPAAGARNRHTRSALRIRDDVAVALVAPDTASPAADVLAADPATGLAVLRVPAVARTFAPVPWVADEPEAPRYVLAALSLPDRVWLQPVVVGALTPLSHPAWSGSVWLAASAADLPGGTLLFTHDGDLLGIVSQEGEQTIVVPGDMLLVEAERLLARGARTRFDPGVDVQPLTPRLQAASGAPGGVMVAWVRDAAPWASALTVGDVVEAIDGVAIETVRDWQVRIARLSDGATATLIAWRAGERRIVPVSVSATPAAAAPRVLGFVLRAVPRVGSEVLRVEPKSAAAEAGVLPGDVIMSVAHVRAPSPREVTDAIATAQGSRPVLLGIARGQEHHVVALVK